MFRRRRLPETLTVRRRITARGLGLAVLRPIEWFLRLSDIEKDALAEIGDTYTADILAAQGFASMDPAAASALQMRADPAGGEAGLIQAIIEAASAKSSKGEAKDATKPESMGGLGKMQRAIKVERKGTLFGKAADG